METREDIISKFNYKIEEQFKNYFPNGWFQIYSDKGLGTEHITIRFGLLKNQEDCANSIRNNDPLFNCLIIYPKTDLLNDDNELYSLNSGLSVNPKEDYLVMSHLKTKIRKSRGNLDKLSKTLDNYFKKVANIVIQNKDDIYNVKNIKPEYLEINN